MVQAFELLRELLLGVAKHTDEDMALFTQHEVRPLTPSSCHQNTREIR